MRKVVRNISSFARREDAVALVEFALFLPVFVLSFFVIVEFSRVFYSYQGAIVGVRDATRYMARVAPGDICVDDTVSGGFLTDAAYNNPPITGVPSNFAPFQIIWRNVDNELGLLPTSVYLNEDKVSATFECVEDLGLRQERVPIVRVSADIEIVLPLIGLLELNALNDIIPNNGRIIRTVIDESRLYGF